MGPLDAAMQPETLVCPVAHAPAGGAVSQGEPAGGQGGKTVFGGGRDRRLPRAAPPLTVSEASGPAVDPAGRSV